MNESWSPQAEGSCSARAQRSPRRLAASARPRGRARRRAQEPEERATPGPRRGTTHGAPPLLAASAETLAEIHNHLYETTVGRPVDAEPVEIIPGTAIGSATTDTAGAVELHCRHTGTDTVRTIRTDAVVLATGYARPGPQPSTRSPT
ncbi:SidA/IucD/PvdA family monooxygenase [Streptomyces cremeus]|uniref:L-lysine N6-monooxygenase MbtG n=1 Tax=Streptomyces cremeus TaxID=66881 RepID=A0ABV5P5L8_STRCM